LKKERRTGDRKKGKGTEKRFFQRRKKGGMKNNFGKRVKKMQEMVQMGGETKLTGKFL